MNLALDDTQTQIAETSREFLSAELPVARLRELGAKPDQPAIDDQTWRRVADLGWFGLAVPEDRGGLGLGLPEETVLAIELGRHLAPGPFRSTIVGAWLASRAGEQDLVAALVGGERRVGFVVENLAVDARKDDLVLVVDAEGAKLCGVNELTPVEAVDPGVRLARISIGEPVVTVPGSMPLARMRVLAAAELLGITEAVRDMSASYARTRIQFDKPIGTFQAVKHRCADMAVAAYATRAQTAQAAVYVEGGHPDADFHAAAAYVLAVRGAAVSTADNIQNHGGIGFTWEHDCHLFLKRAHLLEQLLGAESGSREALLEPDHHEFR